MEQERSVDDELPAEDSGANKLTIQVTKFFISVRNILK